MQCKSRRVPSACQRLALWCAVVALVSALLSPVLVRPATGIAGASWICTTGGAVPAPRDDGSPAGSAPAHDHCVLCHVGPCAEPPLLPLHVTAWVRVPDDLRRAVGATIRPGAGDPGRPRAPPVPA